MACLLKTDDTVIDVAPANGQTFTLAELQGFVGGYIEIVRAPDDPKHPGVRWLYVLNEDGHRLRLPVNTLATIGYVLTTGRPNDVIVGDVVLATWEEIEGDA